MVQPHAGGSSDQARAVRPYWSQVLRALREARGVTREAWADLLGYGLSTVKRWESGEAVPDAAAEAAIVALCQERNLFRRFDRGVLQGLTLMPAWLSDLLAEARLGGALRGPVAPAGPPRGGERGTGETWPPGTSAPLGPATNLPSWLTPCIGREDDLAAVARLLAEHRLVTLTGPGGTGKTRLAVATAEHVQAQYADGAWFVDLSVVTDPALVVPAIARVLAVRESAGETLSENLLVFLRAKGLLLVLDNVEQVVEAAPLLRDLVARAPAVRVLVTSRVRLRVDGEQTYVLAPLPVPAVGEVPALPALAASPAVQLFVTRVQALRPAFTLNADNAAAVAAICIRLDGLPLALELAAARMNLLSPVALLARIEHRLSLLTTGERGRPVRQQTLRGTVQWSWELLDESEQLLFRRLAVFAGGFTLEAAEAVCAAPSPTAVLNEVHSGPTDAVDVFEGLAALVDQSLVHRQDDPGGEPRFRMLATLQEFALEQLEASGEATELRLRHAEYCCVLAEAGFTAVWQRGTYAAVPALARERDNLLAALQWLLEAGEAESGLRLAAALHPYWYFNEPGAGLHWAETFLAEATGDVPPELRGGGHLAAGASAWALGAWDVALGHAEQARALLRGTPARLSLALALNLVPGTRMSSDASRARLELEEARDFARAAGTEPLEGLAAALTVLALLYARLPAEALPYAEEALRIGRRLESAWLTAVSLTTISIVAQLRGDLQAAHRYAEQALPLHQLMRNNREWATSLTQLAFCEAAGGDAGALRTWQASLAEYIELRHDHGMVTTVLGIAALLAARGEAAEAARLLGAMEAQVEEVCATRYRLWAQSPHDQALSLARAALSDEAFARAWGEGQALSLDEAAARALAAPAATPSATNPSAEATT